MRNSILVGMTSFGLMALSLAACALPPAPPPRRPESRIGATGLTGTSWILASLNGQPPLANTVVTLNFTADRVYGTDGCNRFSGSYTLDGTRITFSPLAGTLMACPEPVMRQAQDFQNGLANARAFSAGDGQLTLMDAEGRALATFVAQITDLAGTRWVATSYNNGKQAVVSVLNDTQLTLDFTDDGKVSGSAGCNTFMGIYALGEGNSIKIGPLASTRKLCPTPEGIMDQEIQFLTALESAATFQIDGDRLGLRRADGAMAANFTRVQ